MRNGSGVRGVLLAMALLWGGAALAQEADDPAPPTEQEPRAEPSDDAATPPDAAPNAGRFTGTVTSSGESRSETVTESSETSVSVGVDVAPPPEAGQPRGPGWGRPDGRSGGRSGGRPQGDAASELAGDWTLLVDGGNSCRITLTDKAQFGGWKAETRGCQGDFFMVGQWAGGRGEIRFTNAFDKVAGQLTRTGPNRFEGTRTEDGARIVLTR